MGLGDIGQMFKLQRELKNTQKKIKKNESSADSKDGLVTAKINGEFNLLSLDIKDELINSNDKKKIEKSIISAVNNAHEISKKFAEEEMKKLTGGLNIPGLGNFM